MKIVRALICSVLFIPTYPIIVSLISIFGLIIVLSIIELFKNSILYLLSKNRNILLIIQDDWQMLTDILISPFEIWRIFIRGNPKKKII